MTTAVFKLNEVSFICLVITQFPKLQQSGSTSIKLTMTFSDLIGVSVEIKRETRWKKLVFTTEPLPLLHVI